MKIFCASQLAVLNRKNERIQAGVAGRMHSVQNNKDDVSKELLDERKNASAAVSDLGGVLFRDDRGAKTRRRQNAAVSNLGDVLFRDDKGAETRRKQNAAVSDLGGVLLAEFVENIGVAFGLEEGLLVLIWESGTSDLLSLHTQEVVQVCPSRATREVLVSVCIADFVEKIEKCLYVLRMRGFAV